MHNPDPKRYVIRSRAGGQLYLVDKQIVRWRKAMRNKPHRSTTERLEREAKAKEAEIAAEQNPLVTNLFFSAD